MHNLITHESLFKHFKRHQRSNVSKKIQITIAYIIRAGTNKEIC
jgi:hypothetical protein